MNLYCVSLFIDPTKYDQVRSSLESLGMPTSTMDGMEGDFRYRSFEAAISHVGMLFCESNHFHRHRDFEIGFAEPDQAEFDRLRARIEAAGIPTSPPQYEPSAFVTADSHGPFFFVPSSGYSELNSLLSFRGEVANPEFARYQKLTTLLEPKVLWEKILLEPSAAGSYLIHSLELVNLGLVPATVECPGVFRLAITPETVRFDFTGTPSLSSPTSS